MSPSEARNGSRRFLSGDFLRARLCGDSSNAYETEVGTYTYLQRRPDTLPNANFTRQEPYMQTHHDDSKTDEVEKAGQRMRAYGLCGMYQARSSTQPVARTGGRISQ